MQPDYCGSSAVTVNECSCSALLWPLWSRADVHGRVQKQSCELHQHKSVCIRWYFESAATITSSLGAKHFTPGCKHSEPILVAGQSVLNHLLLPGHLHATGSSAGASQQLISTPIRQSRHPFRTPLARSNAPVVSSVPARPSALPPTSGHFGVHFAAA